MKKLLYILLFVPFALFGQEPISYQLSSAWNMVGYTGCEITPIEEAFQDALGNGSSLEETFNIIKDVRGRMWHPALGENSLLTHLTPGEGYMMFVNGGNTSVQFSEEYCNDITYQLNSGWNMVAFTGNVYSESNIVTALDAALENGAGTANTFEFIKKVNGQFWSDAFAQISSFTPGEAYMMFVNGQETTVSFTENSTQVFENNPGVEFTLPATDNNMSVIFPAGALNDFVGYEIYVQTQDDEYSDYSRSSENSIINEDGSVGIAVIGESYNCQNCDYLPSYGDQLYLYMTSLYGSSIKIELSLPLLYSPSTIEVISDSLSFLGFHDPDGYQCCQCLNIFNPNCLEIMIGGYTPINLWCDDFCNPIPYCPDTNYFEFYFNTVSSDLWDQIDSPVSCNTSISNVGILPEMFTEPTNTGSNMTIPMPGDFLNQFEGGQIGAFSNGICVGLEQIDGSFIAMGLWGDDSSTEYEIDGLLSGEIPQFAIFFNGGVIGLDQTEMNGYTTNSIQEIQNFSLAAPIGCTSPEACNYVYYAAQDDGSCTFANTYYDCSDNCINDSDDDGICDELEVLGCTNFGYVAYDSLATDDDGSCLLTWEESHYNMEQEMNSILFELDSELIELQDDFDLVMNTSISIDLVMGWNMIGFTSHSEQDLIEATQQIDDIIIIMKDNNANVYLPEYSFNGIGNLSPGQGYQIKVSESFSNFNFEKGIVLGCTDNSSLNYNPIANTNDGSCIAIIEGCMDAWAFNYNPFANTQMPGSCYFPICYDPFCMTPPVYLSPDPWCQLLYGDFFTQDPPDNYLSDFTNDIPYDNSGVIYGCTDPNASNYLLGANSYDGSCDYTLQVGDLAEGGIVFYVNETGEHGLVAAMEDIEGTHEWGCFEENVSGADGEAIGTGYQNTMDIVNQGCVTENGGITAAKAALDAEVNGYSDWYLPSKDELYEILSTIGNVGSEVEIGGFSNTHYRSSSEVATASAWNVSFDNGLAYNSWKNNPVRVRVIRSF
jgi:hypothetical protein